MGDRDPRSSSSSTSPRPSTSSASSASAAAAAVKRSDTAMTTAPLTDQEFNDLKTKLNDVGDSTINRLLEPDSGASQAAMHSWSFNTDEFGTGLTTSDTLERNPGFVDPNQLTIGNDSAGADGRQQVSVKMEQTQNQQIFYSPAVVAGEQEHHYVTVVQTEPWTNLQQLPANVEVVGAGPSSEAGAGGTVSSPTCINATHENWPGQFDFKVQFLQYGQSTKNKAWDYSSVLNKLFIDMGKYVQVSFSAGKNPPAGLYIRALPVYSDAAYCKDPVKRCPNHASPSDASNKGFPQEFVDHLIRVNHDGVVYEEDKVSLRLSAVMPFEQPQVGTDHCTHLIRFMCLGSDVGGINRRAVRVIFTLEGENQEVLGRYNVDVRICSCPKRDRQQEESKHHVAQKRAQELAEGIARTNSVFTKPSAKRKKTEVEEFVMVPVAKKDFEKINEFAEAAVCMRNVDKAEEIKEQRRKLLDMHNKKYLNKPHK